LTALRFERAAQDAARARIEEVTCAGRIRLARAGTDDALERRAIGHHGGGDGFGSEQDALHVIERVPVLKLFGDVSGRLAGDLRGGLLDGR
jgi:hypothetical protein